MERTSLQLPPPQHGDADEREGEDDYAIDDTAAPSQPVPNGYDVVFDNGATVVTHWAKVIDADGSNDTLAQSPVFPVSSNTSPEPPRISNSTTEALPLPPISALPRPLTRSALSSLLRAHLSAPLAPGDVLLKCGSSVTALLPTLPDAVLRLAHAKIHAFPYKDVPACWLRAWAEGCLWRCVELLGKEKEEEEGDGQEREGRWLDEVVRVLDMGLILAGGVGREKVFEWAFAALEEMLLATDVDASERQLQADGQEGNQVDRASKRRKLDLRDGGEEDEGEEKTQAPASSPTPKPPTWNCPSSFPAPTTTPPPLRNPIPRVDAQTFDFAAFQAHLDAANPHNPQHHHMNKTTIDDEIQALDLPSPLIITNALAHWPALADPRRRWSDPRYLLRRTLGGRRLVPVEVGRSYTDEGWGQRIMSVGEFMRRFMFGKPGSGDEEGGGSDDVSQGKGEEESREGDGEEHDDDSTRRRRPTPPPPIGYLAQHDLLSQIPALRADIGVPDYCYTLPPPTPSPSSSSTSPSTNPPPAFPLINAWFGPASTISPLHTDPYHNVLCQVVGAKYVRLYAPSQAPAMHPRGVGADGVDMGNTSEVDVGEAIALERGERSEPDERRGPGSIERLLPHRETKKDEQEEEEEELSEKKRAFEAQHPGFLDARCVDAVLAAGEALYVPKGWWHYVTSLGPSFSVSFWWDARGEEAEGEGEDWEEGKGDGDEDGEEG